MPDSVINVPPFILIKPKLRIGPAGAGVVFECGANEVDVSPEQDSSDTETFCGLYTSYKPAKWTITVTALTSYGTLGLWNTLRPFVNTVVAFALLPDGAAAVGVSNPLMTAQAYFPEFAFLSAPVGETSEFDLVFAVQGVPTFATTGTFPSMVEGDALAADDLAAGEAAA